MSWWMKTHGQSKHDKADKNRAWKKGGRKMVQVAHRQITLLPIPSSASLPFFPSSRGEAINLHSSSRSSHRFPRFRKRPGRDGSFHLGQGSRRWSHLHPLATVTWKPKEWTHREPPRGGGTRFSRNLGEQPFSPGVKKTVNFLAWNFHESSPTTQGSLIFHREDPDAFKYGGKWTETSFGGVLFSSTVSRETWVVRRRMEEWLRCVDRKRQVVAGLMGIQIMFARVIDRVSGFVVPRILFSINSILRLDDEMYADEIISFLIFVKSNPLGFRVSLLHLWREKFLKFDRCIVHYSLRINLIIYSSN